MRTLLPDTRFGRAFLRAQRSIGASLRVTRTLRVRSDGVRSRVESRATVRLTARVRIRR